MTPNVFVVGDGSSYGEGYMSNIDMIHAVLEPGEDLTLLEIFDRVSVHFGPTSVCSLKNAIRRAVKRGDVEITSRGRENRYRLSSSPS